MRILFLAHRLPYPPHKGEKIRAWNILRYLADRHEVHLGCLVDDSRDLAAVDQARRAVHSLLFERVNGIGRVARAVPALLSSRPISVGCFYSRRLQRRIDQLIEAAGIDAVFCSSSPMAEYVFRSRHAARLSPSRRVMDLIDVDSAKWSEYARTSGLWRAWLYGYEARHLARFERQIARTFGHLLVVSEREREYFPAADEPTRVMAMPNGVDLDYFSPRWDELRTAADPVLVFTGVMDYRPNVEGVTWFADRVLPVIRRAVPRVRLCVVGDRPSRAVRRLARRPGVLVTGFVADVREYLASACVSIAPLRIARGIQNKVLEAMAMGLPVIATRQAFEGLVAVPGRDLIVASEESTFAAAAIELLRDGSRAAEIGRNARRCVEQHYAWTANLRLLDEILPTYDAARMAAAVCDRAAPAGAERRRRP